MILCTHGAAWVVEGMDAICNYKGSVVLIVVFWPNFGTEN